MFVRSLKVIGVRSKVAEEDGDLEGILHVGVSDMELVEGYRGNATYIEDFITASLWRQAC